jgi:hypothetical protein
VFPVATLRAALCFQKLDAIPPEGSDDAAERLMFTASEPVQAMDSLVDDVKRLVGGANGVGDRSCISSQAHRLLPVARRRRAQHEVRARSYRTGPSPARTGTSDDGPDALVVGRGSVVRPSVQQVVNVERDHSERREYTAAMKGQ